MRKNIITAPGIKTFCFLFVITAFSSCASSRVASYNPAKKIPPDKLKEDFTLLKKILEANHPSLYWYTPKDSIDGYFNEVFNSVNDSLTEMQFKNKVAWFISKIHCGHTSVRLSNTAGKYFFLHPSAQFPLAIKAWGDSLVVLANANSNGSVLKRGTSITSINGINSRELLDSIFQFISTDAYSNNFKDQLSSFSFPSYYAGAFPLKDSFAVGFIDTTGMEQITFAKLYIPVKDTLKNKKNAAPPIIQQPKITPGQIRQSRLRNRRNLIFDSVNNLAYMRLPTFGGAGLRPFFAQSFQALQNSHTQNLVIDLRENGGGSLAVSTALTRYIAAQPFHVADTVAAVTRSFPYGRYIHPSLLYQLAMRFTTRKCSDNKFHFTTLEKHLYRPYTDLHFNGNVYIIQGGFTFSAATMFISHVKGQPNVTIVGEETGGGNYGMSAVYLPTIVLPNSKVRVVLPVYRVVLERGAIKDGRGIQPDVLVEPSSVAIKRGIDLKLQKVRELIKNNKGQ